MTPDLMGRRARVVQGQQMGWKKKLKKDENSFSDKLHQQVITAVQWGHPVRNHPVTSRSRRSLLLFIVGNIWLLVCRDMAI